MKYRKILAALVVVSFIPFPTTTVPEWRLRYVDMKGRPVSGLPVSQTWQNYSIESQAHYVDGITDAQGYAIFPEHRSWSPLVVRIFHPVMNVLSTGVHASFGSSSWVVEKCDVKSTQDTQAVYFGQPLPTQVILEYENRSDLRSAMPGSLPIPSGCATVEAQVRNAA